MKRPGFTLIEITLALSIMGGGLLTLVGLYALGFRENQQSREDVAATALADRVLSPLIQALSATNVTWNSFRKLGDYPSARGWRDYYDVVGGRVRVSTDPQQKAAKVVEDVVGQLNFAGGEKPSVDWNTLLSGTGMSCGLVVLHKPDSAVVRLAFRAVKAETPDMLLSMPLFYTEVRFQGVVE